MLRSSNATLSVYISVSTLPEWAAGDGKRAFKFQLARNALLALENANIKGTDAYINPAIKNFRPQVLVMVKLRTKDAASPKGSPRANGDTDAGT